MWFVVLFAVNDLAIYALSTNVQIYAWFSHIMFTYVAAATLRSDDNNLMIASMIFSICGFQY